MSGLAENNPIADNYRNHVLSFLPLLRSYKQTRAADHLENWVNGTLELAPLLEVSAQLGVARVLCGAQQSCLTRFSAARLLALRCQLRACRRGEPDNPVVRSFDPDPTVLSRRGLGRGRFAANFKRKTGTV